MKVDFQTKHRATCPFTKDYGPVKITSKTNEVNNHLAGHAFGIWICGCSLFYRIELWASKSAGAKGDFPIRSIGSCTHANAFPAR